MFTLPYMLLFAYLLGSIPTSVWVSKLVFHKDIRNYGSGNAGATNSFRYLGAKWAGFILLVDIFKGLLAVKLLNLLPSEAQDSLWGHLNNQLLLGMAAVLGHVFPVFAGFRGGKGVATFLGVIIAIGWQFALITLGVFALVYALCHYVAIASMSGSLAFTLSMILLSMHSENYEIMCILVSFGSLLLIYKHRKNIRNLIRKTEDKTYFFKKRDNSRQMD